ncbi:MAG: hypothetical protein RLZZ46_1716, partial [Bacteroidota bacterium]
KNMASFDIVSKVDAQTLDNVINIARKEIVNRFDFRDSKTEIELNKKDYLVVITTENEMRITAIEDAIRSRMIKQGLSPMALDFGKSHYASGNMLKKEIKVKQGVDKETGKKIIKVIKDLRLKVEAQMMDDQVRVNGKKIDELQAVISHLRNSELEIPLQFINMKS